MESRTVKGGHLESCYQGDVVVNLAVSSAYSTSISIINVLP